MAETRTLKLDFVVKEWQNQKILFGILNYALCRFQNYKIPVGRTDTLIINVKKILHLVVLPALVILRTNKIQGGEGRGVTCISGEVAALLFIHSVET